MDFMSVRELRSTSVWDKLTQQEEIVLTNNGKPAALILKIPDGNLEELLRSVRQAKAMRALNAIRTEAAERGFLSGEEIEAEIQAYRNEKREKSS
jgi:antitoxin (DNA-binding transcriptional repressor) of toxin-antitoxin stability system